jgi:hypothetical protein
MTWEFVADRPEFEWLTEKSGGWQFGEQGILVALANAINKPGQCVEIGAGDGEGLPLTIEPFYKYGLPCVLFEKQPESLANLQLKYPKANLCGEFFCSIGGPISVKPLLVVIDVDSIDMLIMEDVLRYSKPLIVMVEHFDKCHPRDTLNVNPVAEWLLGAVIDGGFTIQNNAATIECFAKSFNYTRLGTTRVNSIFVHDSLVEKVTNHVPS